MLEKTKAITKGARVQGSKVKATRKRLKRRTLTITGENASHVDPKRNACSAKEAASKHGKGECGCDFNSLVE